MPPIAMLEADERPRVAARVPAPRAALDTVAASPAEPAPAAAADAPVARRRIPSLRRLPHPPGRRAPLWLAALIAGALVAAGPTVLGGSQPVRVDGYGYGLGMEVDASGDLTDAGARRGITEAEARARLGELTASRAAREPKIVVPLNGYRLTSCYCNRWGGQFHPGWDMAAPLGTPIVSATDGVVLEAGPAGGYGNAVYIQDEDGNVHVYGHMRYYSARAGQIVRAGEQIAQVGDEGFSTGPHLHWQIHEGGRDGGTIDPERWLAARDVER